MKGVVPTGARVKGRTRDTWLLIGSVVAAVSLLIILAALFTLGLSKKRSRRRSASRGMTNRRQVFEGEEGSSNLAFQEDADLKVIFKFLARFFKVLPQSLPQLFIDHDPW